MQNQIKLSRPFLQSFARFRLRSKCTCCLGNSRCSTVKEKSSICQDYPLVCPCFFPHQVSFTFSKAFLQKKCSFTRRYQHDSVLELFPHFGRRIVCRRLSASSVQCRPWSRQGGVEKITPTALATPVAVGVISTPPKQTQEKASFIYTINIFGQILRNSKKCAKTLNSRYWSQILIDHKNALVFHQTVSGKSPEVFLTGEPNTNKKKTASKHQLITHSAF